MRSCGNVNESHYTNRSINADERRNSVRGSHSGSSYNLRIILRWAGSSNSRKAMTSRARIEIEPRSQTICYAFHLDKRGNGHLVEEIQLARCQPACKGLA